MGLFGKFVDSIRLSDNEDDDYYLDDDYEEEKPPRRGFLGGRKDDDYYDDNDEEQPQPQPARPRFMGGGNRSSKVVPMKRNMEVCMVKPTSMDDSKEICDYLLSGKSVVLNMEGLHTEIAQRIIDFTSGATYSMNGNLQKISDYIFIATPESVALSGDFQDLLGDAMDTSGLNLRI